MITDFLLYTIKDTKVGTFTKIEMFSTEAQAERWFDLLCKKSDIAEDLELFKIGAWNAFTGQFVLPEQPIFVKGGVKNA